MACVCSVALLSNSASTGCNSHNFLLTSAPEGVGLGDELSHQGFRFSLCLLCKFACILLQAVNRVTFFSEHPCDPLQLFSSALAQHFPFSSTPSPCVLCILTLLIQVSSSLVRGTMTQPTITHQSLGNDCTLLHVTGCYTSLLMEKPHDIHLPWDKIRSFLQKPQSSGYDWLRKPCRNTSSLVSVGRKERKCLLLSSRDRKFPHHLED